MGQPVCADDTPSDIEHRQNAHDKGSCITFSPKGNVVATGGADGTVKIWDIASGGSRDKVFRSQKSAPSSLSFSTDGNLCAFSSTTKVDNFAIKLVSTTKKAPSYDHFTGHQDTVNQVHFIGTRSMISCS